MGRFSYLKNIADDIRQHHLSLVANITIFWLLLKNTFSVIMYLINHFNIPEYILKFYISDVTVHMNIYGMN